MKQNDVTILIAKNAKRVQSSQRNSEDKTFGTLSKPLPAGRQACAPCG